MTPEVVLWPVHACMHARAHTHTQNGRVAEDKTICSAVVPLLLPLTPKEALSHKMTFHCPLGSKLSSAFLRNRH